MQDGIYHVRFSSSQGLAGEGLAVVKAGSVNGGDFGYLYLGQLLADGERVSGQLEIKRWNASAQSVFGPLVNFALTLTGTVNGESFRVSGGIPGQPNLKISIDGRRLSLAA